MGHNINGFIGPLAELRRAAESLPGARVVSLLKGDGFLPVTEDLVDESESVPFKELERMTSRLAAWAMEISTTIPLAYVVTDYHGGQGGQAAIAWADGQIVFGPLRTLDTYKDGKFVPTPLLEGAINQALRALGFDREASLDEFDALGLGSHRSNSKWLASED